MSNTNQLRAKQAKDDEFYTKYSDIESELQHYTESLHGQRVYANCDSVTSPFVEYFTREHHAIRYKSFTATGFGESAGITYNESGDSSFIPLHNFAGTAGDCFGGQCEAILANSDVIVTNPPFTLFWEFLELLYKHGKKFLIIGPANKLGSPRLFPLLRDRRIWTGVNCGGFKFDRPDGSIEPVHCCWYTNIEHGHSAKLPAVKNQREPVISDCGNYLCVDRCADIPADYFGKIAVPDTIVKYLRGDYSEFTLLGTPKITIGGVKRWQRVLIQRTR